jgi:hypothetical protein
MQHDVAEHRRGQSTLRRPGVGARIAPLFDDAGLQHLADEVNESLILDAFTQAGQDYSMRNGVEALDQVALDNPRGSSSVSSSHMAEALDGASSRSEASGTGPKDRFIDGFQHLRDRRLDNPVTDGRNA